MNLPRALAVTIAAVLCAAPASGNRWSDAIPPERFQSDNIATVIMVRDVRAFCRTDVPDGYRILACTVSMGGRKVIVMPNPCLLARTEWFARIQCHELSHVNGWSANHEE